MREDSAADSLLDYETEAIERDRLDELDAASWEDYQRDIGRSDDYDAYEAAQLEKLDAIRNGDFEDYFQPFGEAHYYERYES